MIKKIKKLFLISLVIFLFSSSFVFAADIDTFFTAMPKYIKIFTQIIIGLVMVFLFWGFVKYMFQDKKEEGKGFIVWGIIGLFTIFSVWAIIFFMQRTTLGTIDPGIPNPPALR